MNRRELSGSLLVLAGIAASLQLKAQTTKGEAAAARVGFLAIRQHPAFARLTAAIERGRAPPPDGVRTEIFYLKGRSHVPRI